MWYHSFFWGLLATSSLILGGLAGILFSPGKRILGIIMGFGAGALISAVAYELVFESIKMAKGSGFPGAGFLLGALVFFLCDKMLENTGGKHRKAITHSSDNMLLIPMILAIILDGIPESLVIGLGMLKGSGVSLAMLVAVFISNLPEAIAGTSGMKASGWSVRKIMVLWLGVTLMCSFATVAGSSLLVGIQPTWIALINGFAGGAILMMLSNTMMPEAYEHGGKLAGIFTVVGFAVSVLIVLIENPM